MIGLGAMGLGMARNLAKAGYLTAVYNRTTAKTTEFKKSIVFISPTIPLFNRFTGFIKQPDQGRVAAMLHGMLHRRVIHRPILAIKYRRH